MSQPIKFIKTSIGSVSIAASQTINGVSIPYRWNAILGITAQAHSDNTTTPTPDFYTGANVNVGDYVVSDPNGTSCLINSISSQSSSTVTCVLEDVNSFNALNDSTGNLNGLLENGAGIVGYIYSVVNGSPILGNIPTTLPGNLAGTSFAANIMNRFASQAGGISGVNPTTGYLPASSIPPAAPGVAGAVKVPATGSAFSVAADGTLSLNAASTTQVGGVKAPATGGSIAIAADGTVSVVPSSATVAGGVKVPAGSSHSVAADGTLTLNPASATVTGGVKVAAGSPFAVATDGTLSLALSVANIPPLPFTQIATGLPTTLAGYGITDALSNSADVDGGSF